MTVACRPVFAGGQSAFLAYVSKRLKKPKGPRQRGTVQVTFTVLTSGAVSGVHVKPGNGLSPAYDAALVEVISNMPPLFHPGGCNGNSKAMEVTESYVFD
jgi:protein TonB